MPSTVTLHRVVKAPPERVYRAFIDGDAMAKWLPPDGFTGKMHSIDAKVGGSFRMSFTNFANGQSHAFGGSNCHFAIALHLDRCSKMVEFAQRFGQRQKGWFAICQFVGCTNHSR